MGIPPKLQIRKAPASSSSSQSNRASSGGGSSSVSNSPSSYNPPLDTSTNTSSTRSSGTSFAQRMGLGDNFYDDDRNYSAKEAANYLNSSSLFDKNHSVGKIETDSETMNGMTRVANGGMYKVTMDTDGDGDMEEVSCAEAMAASFDSEYDLYIAEELDVIIRKYGTKFYTGNGFLNPEAQKELEAKGIYVDKINNRTYTFSIKDENGNVMEDSNGKKASILFGDWVIPDGYAQRAETNLASMLDSMGYDCVSKADFVGHEKEYYEMMELIAADVQSENSGLTSSGKKVEEIYGNVNTSWQGGGFASNDAGAISAGPYDDMTGIEAEQAKEKQQKQEESIKEAFDKIYKQKDIEGLSDKEVVQVRNEVAQKVANILNIDINIVLEIVK